MNLLRIEEDLSEAQLWLANVYLEDLDSDLQELQRKLPELQRNLFDLRPSMPEVGQALVRSVDKNFRTGGRYQVIGSREYSGGTQTRKQSKRSKKVGGQTLQKSGALAASINAQIGGDFILLSSPLIYAAAQHYGATIKHPGGTPYIVIGGRAKFLKKDGE